jgi:aspartate carbamoyltransferase catalytic subunit
MIKNLISLNDLNKDELISLLDFAENFIDAD